MIWFEEGRVKFSPVADDSAALAKENEQIVTVLQQANYEP